jgi:hypothetical protein
LGSTSTTADSNAKKKAKSATAPLGSTSTTADSNAKKKAKSAVVPLAADSKAKKAKSAAVPPAAVASDALAAHEAKNKKKSNSRYAKITKTDKPTKTAKSTTTVKRTKMKRTEADATAHPIYKQITLTITPAALMHIPNAKVKLGGNVKSRANDAGFDVIVNGCDTSITFGYNPDEEGAKASTIKKYIKKYLKALGLLSSDDDDENKKIKKKDDDDKEVQKRVQFKAVMNGKVYSIDQAHGP